MASREELQILQQQRKESKAYLDELLAGKTAEERMNVKKSKAYKDELARLREINEQVKEIQANNKIVVDDLIRQEASLKSMTGIQSYLGKLDRKRVDMQAGISDEFKEEHKLLNGTADIIQEISKLSAEDSIAREIKLKELDDQIKLAEKNHNISDEVVQNLRQQRDEVKLISGLTEKQQKFYG